MSVAHKFLARFLFLSFFSGIFVGMSAIVINLYAVHMEAGAAQIGLITGMQGFGVLITGIPFGILIDRYGAKVVYVLGGLIGSTVFLFVPMATTPWTLLAVTFVVGLFASMRYVSMNSIFFEHLELIGNNKSGWYKGAQSAGMVFIGPVLGIFLVNHIGFRFTFYTIGMWILVTAIIAHVILTQREVERELEAFTWLGTVHQLKGLLKNRLLVTTSIVEFVALSANACFSGFIIAIALRVFHLPKESAALFISTQGVVFVVTVFSLNAWLSRLGERYWYMTAIGVIVSGLLFLGLAAAPLQLWLGAVLLGAGLGMINIVNVARIARSGHKKGKVAGFFSLFSMGGGMAGPVIGGFIGTVYGLQATYLCLVPVFLALGLYLKLKVTGRKWLAAWTARIRDVALGLILPVGLLVLWEAVTRLGYAPRELLVPPREVWESFCEFVKDGTLAENLGVSLTRIFFGFSWGAAAGVLFGTAMGNSRNVERFAGPLFHAFRQVPMFGWMPFLILLTGIDETFKIIFVGLTAFIPMVLNTCEGVKNIPGEYLEVAEVFAYGRRRLFWRVIIPGAMPSIFTGLRTSLSMAWMSVVGAELVAASSGIGNLMAGARNMFRYDIVFVGVIVIGVVGFAMNFIAARLEAHVLRWRKTFVEK